MQPYGGGAGGGMQHQVMDCAKAFVGTFLTIFLPFVLFIEAFRFVVRICSLIFY
jgi:hypothetical protein